MDKWKNVMSQLKSIGKMNFQDILFNVSVELSGGRE